MQDSQLTAISSFITLQKLFPADPAPLVLIVQIGEGELLLHRHPSSSFLEVWQGNRVLTKEHLE